LGIKAIVFDYGQVISLPQDPRVIDRLAEKAGVEREKFEPFLWEFRDEYDRGKISAAGYYEKILSRLDVKTDEKTIEEIAAMDSASWKNIDPETVSLMEDVKKAGYTLGILSNMPHDFLAWARKNIPVFSIADVSLFSCEVELIKPEPAIYVKLLSMLNMESGEVVFFDDREENITSASFMGIKAFLWQNSENARRELSSLGIRL